MDISSLLSPNDTPASRHAATQRPDNDSAPAAPAKPAEATGPPAGDGNAISGGAKAAQTSAVRGPLARGRGGRRRNGDQNAPKASPPTTGQGRRGTTKTSKRKVSTSADEPDLATPSPLTSASVKGTTGSNGAVGRAPQPSRSSSDTLHRRALLNRPHNAIIQPSPEAVAVRPNHSYPGSIPMDNAVKYSASLKPTAKLPSTGAHYSRSTPNIPSHTAAYHTATSAGMDVLAGLSASKFNLPCSGR